MLTSLILYCVLGALAGILAGLLGIGGGAVVVPMLVFTFKWQNLSPRYRHSSGDRNLAGEHHVHRRFQRVGSSQARRRELQVFRYIAPGILMGTYCGSFVAARIPARYLQIFFVAFLLYVATNMLLNKNRTQAGSCRASPE